MRIRCRGRRLKVNPAFSIPTLRVFEGSQYLFDVLFTQGFDLKTRERETRALITSKIRVLGGGADQGHQAVPRGAAAFLL